MGASDFTVYRAGASARDAFREAVDAAKYEDGHGGYSGTIAEKHDFKIVQRVPVTREEAHKIIEAKLDENDKWGPAFAVPVRKEGSEEVSGWYFFGFASS